MYVFSDSPSSEKIESSSSKSTLRDVRKGNDALSSVFKYRSKNGQFDPEMQKKLDEVLHGGVQVKKRKNVANEDFHRG